MLEQEYRKAPVAADPAAPEDDQAVLERYLEESRRSGAFMAAHYQEFFQRYPDQYVGVYLEELVAVAPTIGEMMDQVDALGLPRYSVRIRFMGKVKGPKCWTQGNCIYL